MNDSNVLVDSHSCFAEDLSPVLAVGNYLLDITSDAHRWRELLTVEKQNGHWVSVSKSTRSRGSANL
jgi:hypothetical protein